MKLLALSLIALATGLQGPDGGRHTTTELHGILLAMLLVLVWVAAEALTRLVWVASGRE